MPTYNDDLHTITITYDEWKTIVDNIDDLLFEIDPIKDDFLSEAHEDEREIL